jgi:HEXXH motif-containing protein
MRVLVHAQRSKHLLLLRLVVATASRVHHPRAKELAMAYEVLADAQADQPVDVEPLLRHPPVGAWAIRALRDLRNGADLDHGYLTALATAAAILVRADFAAEIALVDGCLFLPFLGRADLTTTCPYESVTVRCRAEGGEILTVGTRIPIPENPRLDGDGWWGIRHVTAHASGRTISLLLDDLDPYRFPGARTVDRLDAVVLGRWRQLLAGAWALLVAQHPETAEEIATGMTVMVPLQPLQGHEVSATSRHCFGAIGLSQPSDGRSFAAALAHERQHGKLSALLDLVSMIDDAGRTRWYAPWRDDPRPLGALLQGAYAHLGVAAFWRTQRHLERGEAALHAHAEFARWRDETRAVVSTLQVSGALTPQGSRFVDGMAAALDAWREEAVPAAALRSARTTAARHRAAWHLRHGSVSETKRI